MSTATTLLYEATGVATAGVPATTTSVDAGTIKFGLADAVDASGSPITVPTATGNQYSFVKSLFLNVTVAATTSTNLSNRTISYDTVPTGLNYFFAAVAKGSYVQATAAAAVANTSANGTAPAGYTAITATAATYDAANSSSTATGMNGAYCTCCAGVSNAYTAGGGISADTIFTVGYSEQ